jgi:pimeloyl-ACP methyl ester carboxylesterase
MRWRRAARAFVVSGFVVSLIAYAAVGDLLTRPSRRDIGPPPGGLNAQTLSFPCRSGAVLAAWHAAPPKPKAAVLVLHGLHADRVAMLSRTRLLFQQGYAVLVPDLRAHGESTGD